METVDTRVRKVYLIVEEGIVTAITFKKTSILLQEVPRNHTLREIEEALGFRDYILLYENETLIRGSKREVSLTDSEQIIDELNVQLADVKHQLAEVLEWKKKFESEELS